MTEPAWQQARLIPTSGINGAQEQERRATSALLAVMSSVREFGRAITSPFGAPAGNVRLQFARKVRVSRFVPWAAPSSCLQRRLR